jgi:hypothetical protein
MARDTLSNHWKFFRLVRYLGSRIMARGALELLWEGGYDSGDPGVGTAEDVEARLEWKGEAGALTAALARAGFLDPVGFDRGAYATDLEAQEARDAATEATLAKAGRWEIHDLMVHAPTTVRRRMEREMKREEQGQTLREIRQKAGRKGAAARSQKAASAQQTTAGDTGVPAKSSTLYSQHSTPNTQHSTPKDSPRASAREKASGKESVAPPLILTGTPDAPKGTPQGAALDFWHETVWPSLSSAPPPRPSKEAMVNLAKRCKEQGLPSVLDAMGRFHSAAKAGKVKREFSSLLWFCTRGFEQWLPGPAHVSEGNPFRAGGAE